MARGFTLFELLVVLVIIVTVTMVVLTSQGAFNRSIVLKNTAYDIALALRSAQSLGLGTRAAAGVTNVGYGVRFVRNTNSFIVFPDKYPPPNTAAAPANCHPLPVGTGNVQEQQTSPDALYGNCQFDAAEDTPYQTFTLGNGVKITNLCVYAGSSWRCTSPAITQSVDVVFSRPNSEPLFAYSTSVGGPASYQLAQINNVSKICIKITSPEGGARAIKIESSGLINPDVSEAVAGLTNGC